MTTQCKTIPARQDLSPWQVMRMWLRTFVQALDYDSQQYVEASVVQLKQEIAALNKRLLELEGTPLPDSAVSAAHYSDRG